MRIIIVILVVAIILAPFIYWLFFTTTVDRWVLRLQTGERSKKLGAAADAVRQAAAQHVEELQELQQETRAAVKDMQEVIAPPRVNRGRVSYAIQNLRNPSLYWSVHLDWDTAEHRMNFSAADKRTLPLPEDGQWQKLN